MSDKAERLLTRLTVESLSLEIQAKRQELAETQRARKRLSRAIHALQREIAAAHEARTYLRYRIALFVHGCFWHGHDCPKGRQLPVTNAVFWRKKIEANRARDHRARRALNAGGWEVWTVWECETRKQIDLDHALNRLDLEHAQNRLRPRRTASSRGSPAPEA